MCPRMRVDMALSITKETQSRFVTFSKNHFWFRILLLPFVTSRKSRILQRVESPGKCGDIWVLVPSRRHPLHSKSGQR